MTYGSLPSDLEVLLVLAGLSKSKTPATELCAALMKKGYSEQESQLAMQRASSSGGIYLNQDWTLSVPDLSATSVEDPELSQSDEAPDGRHIPTNSPYTCGQPYSRDKEDNRYCSIHGEIRQLQR